MSTSREIILAVRDLRIRNGVLEKLVHAQSEVYDDNQTRTDCRIFSEWRTVETVDDAALAASDAAEQ